MEIIFGYFDMGVEHISGVIYQVDWILTFTEQVVSINLTIIPFYILYNI